MFLPMCRASGPLLFLKKICGFPPLFSVALVWWMRSSFASSSRQRISSSLNPFSAIRARYMCNHLYTIQGWYCGWWHFSKRPRLCQDVVLLCLYHTCFHAIALPRFRKFTSSRDRSSERQSKSFVSQIHLVHLKNLMLLCNFASIFASLECP